jgi:adenylate kinase
MIIVITGTPGVGKSRLAKKLAQKLGYDRLDISEHYKEIAIGYDKSKQCYDIDMKKFEKLVRRNEKKGLIVDSHIGHLLPKKMVDVCVVLLCSDLKKLESRLKKRKYSKKKIRENLDAEIFQVCLNEAKERSQKIVTLESGSDKLVNDFLKQHKISQ